MKVKSVYLLDLGWLLGYDLGYFVRGVHALTPKRRRKQIDVPVSAAVVEHSDGIVLFDTGFDPRHAFGKRKRFDERVNSIERQLKAVGLSPADIRYVVLSHLHFDHAGQATIFKELNVPLIVHKKELQYALYRIWIGKTKGYLPSDLEPLMGARWLPLDRDSFNVMEGISLEWTGGHTPGHMVMKVESDSGRSMLFAGDFLHIPEEYRLEEKGWLLGDEDEWNTYLKRLKFMVEAGKTELVIGHDPDLWQRYPKTKAIRF